MKTFFKPFAGLLFLLLLSCSKNNPETSFGPGETIEMPVSIEMPTGNSLASRASDHEFAKEGTCNANKVMLLVFKGAKGATESEIKDFQYLSRKTLNCRSLNGTRVARGSITGETNATYAIFAIAYNDTTDQTHFKITDTTSTLEAVKIQLIPISGGTSADSYYTPEFFAGYVTPQGTRPWTFSAEGEVRLSGTLYRAVGKCSFTIPNVPDNIREVAWITDEMTDHCNLYNPNSMFDEYPIGFPGSDNQLKKPSKVASVQRGTLAEGTTTWDAYLETFFIPLEESLFYIDAIDDNGTTIRYLVKCPDRIENTPWIGIVNVIVSEYKFSVSHNWMIGISGTFDQLKNSGNVVIDLSEAIEKYEGGLLTPN